MMGVDKERNQRLLACTVGWMFAVDDVVGGGARGNRSCVAVSFLAFSECGDTLEVDPQLQTRGTRPFWCLGRTR